MNPTYGQRLLTWGNSCSGKSSLAEAIAESEGFTFVELDALNWLPNWVGLNTTDPDRLEQLFREATEGDTWIAAGSYSEQAKAAFWPKLETIIWLDLPRHLLMRRCFKRCFLRWWNKELLWGTNRENFFAHFMVWRGEDSLFWWVWTQHARKRRDSWRYMTDPKWSHIRWVHLRSEHEVNRFIESLKRPTNAN